MLRAQSLTAGRDFHEATNPRIMDITKPIIIVGTGRCGSTLFHRLLAKHPQMMWLSPLCYKHPHRPEWNRRAVAAMDNPLLRRLFGEKIRPGENYRFWDKYAYGFSEPCRDLVRSDVSARVKKQVRAAFEPMLTPKKNRLLIKITGWPRIGFLNEIFPDAKFIHVLRDGRAVASSLLHVGFWKGWHGPQSWRAGLLSPEDQALWESYDRSFAALAGIEWRIQMRAMEAARRVIDPSLFLEVKYETFCEQPVESFRQVLEFAEIPWSDEFEGEIRAAHIRSTSNRWRNDLAAGQQAILDDLLAEDLRRYGYGDAEATEAFPEPAQRG
jgi:omega-hydroxy-beta-dihydromenaquinone-9 sulfotransferase